ncbi:hypothetical protein VMCG_08615 [Cytospora schulzeri]|uniref:Uncharacterized protein n=1 Tax=Cytospora schulzeri TaxID=448051 RepID=A0A423VTA8_9PEZI|nr:hypothetical protein VMCG_08615 [Valsa malicola]
MDHRNHIFYVPRLRAFDWPPRGSLEYMRNWTLEKGITTLETRMVMQGRRLEPPALSPMSAAPAFATRSPTTPVSGTYRSVETPLTAYSEDLDYENSIVLLNYNNHKRSGRKDTHPPSKCFDCGLPWLDARQLSPSGESSHWFVDIHDGVSRKMAYLFCWRCVEGVQRRLRPSHVGCGHPSVSLPFFSAEVADQGRIEREDLMFCRGCRESIAGGKGLKSKEGAGRVS